METKWEKIFESDRFKVGIYDNCSKRVYSGGTRLKIEVDGIRWVGNTGGFHVYKYFIDKKEGEKLIEKITSYDADEASMEDLVSELDKYGKDR